MRLVFRDADGVAREGRLLGKVKGLSRIEGCRDQELVITREQGDRSRLEEPERPAAGVALSASLRDAGKRQGRDRGQAIVEDPDRGVLFRVSRDKVRAIYGRRIDCPRKAPGGNGTGDCHLRKIIDLSDDSRIWLRDIPVTVQCGNCKKRISARERVIGSGVLDLGPAHFRKDIAGLIVDRNGIVIVSQYGSITCSAGICSVGK